MKNRHHAYIQYEEEEEAHIRLVHELKPNDAQRRIQYSRRFQKLCLENNEFIHKLITSPFSPQWSRQ